MNCNASLRLSSSAGSVSMEALRQRSRKASNLASIPDSQCRPPNADHYTPPEPRRTKRDRGLPGPLILHSTAARRFRGKGNSFWRCSRLHNTVTPRLLYQLMAETHCPPKRCSYGPCPHSTAFVNEIPVQATRIVEMIPGIDSVRTAVCQSASDCHIEPSPLACKARPSNFTL